MVDDVAMPTDELPDELPDGLLGELHFTCPRCAREVSEAYYGPCTDCVVELKLLYPGEAREIEADDYVPKMNVTPNAVALKDD